MAQLYDGRQTSILVSIIRKWSRRSRQLIVACPFRLFFQFLSVTELIERRGGIERRRSPFCPLFCWSASARLHHNKMAAQGLSARALESISDSPVFFFFLPPPSAHVRRVEVSAKRKERVTGGEWPTAHLTPSCSATKSDSLIRFFFNFLVNF